MFRPPRRSGRVLILLWLSGMVALWIGQGRHNQLPLEFESEEFASRTFQPGEIFAPTLIALMNHELQDGFGWRPNDFFLWGPRLWADNNAARQLGLLQAFRKSLQAFKEHLTKDSDNNVDPDVFEADALFASDGERFWFPSAESQFIRGIERLRRYVEGVRNGSRRSHPMTTGSAELGQLLQIWSDLLADAHANLHKEQEADGRSVWLRTDRYFYAAQGCAHVQYALLSAIKHEYYRLLTANLPVQLLIDEAREALRQAALMNPPLILNGSPSGLLANHRRNLDAYIVEARQKMVALQEELRK